jgi:hypothetical protein
LVNPVRPRATLLSARSRRTLSAGRGASLLLPLLVAACGNAASVAATDESTASSSAKVTGHVPQPRVEFDFVHADWHGDKPILPESWGGSDWTPFYVDVDGDGVNDRVIFDPGSANWYAITSTGVAVPPGWPSNPAWWGSGAFQAFMADIDGDGKADRVMMNPANAEWFAYGSAIGVAPPPGWGVNPVQWGPVGAKMMLADVDGDGKADRVCVDAYANWYLAPTTGALPAAWHSDPFQWGVGSWTQMLADIDGDGKADRVTVDPATGDWYALPSTGVLPPGWPTNPHQWGGSNWVTLMADVDGDGRADRITINPAGPTWYAITSTGALPSGWRSNPQTWGSNTWLPLMGNSTSSNTGIQSYLVFLQASAHNRNSPDLHQRVLFDFNTFDWYTDSGALLPQQWGGIDPTASASVFPMIGDIDGDGSLDRITYEPAGANWFFSTSTMTVPPAWPTDPTTWGAGAAPGAFWNMFVIDVDGDGKMDRVGIDPWGNWYTAPSTGTLPRGWPSIPTQWGGGSNSWKQLMADLDGDGIPDRVTIDPNANWYAATSTGIPVPPGWPSNPTQWGVFSWTQMLADVDGDGKADRVTVDPEANWYLASTTGRLTPAWPSDPSQWGGAGWPQMLDDIDGDGKADRVTFDPNGNWYTWTSTGRLPPSWPSDPSWWGTGAMLPMVGNQLAMNTSYRELIVRLACAPPALETSACAGQNPCGGEAYYSYGRFTVNGKACWDPFYCYPAPIRESTVIGGTCAVTVPGTAVVTSSKNLCGPWLAAGKPGTGNPGLPVCGGGGPNGGGGGGAPGGGTPIMPITSNDSCYQDSDCISGFICTGGFCVVDNTIPPTTQPGAPVSTATPCGTDYQCGTQTGSNMACNTAIGQCQMCSGTFCCQDDDCYPVVGNYEAACNTQSHQCGEVPKEGFYPNCTCQPMEEDESCDNLQCLALNYLSCGLTIPPDTSEACDDEGDDGDGDEGEERGASLRR